MRVLQQDVPSILFKVEASDPKLNVAREEDVAESAVDNNANAEKLVPVLEKKDFFSELKCFISAMKLLSNCSSLRN